MATKKTTPRCSSCGSMRRGVRLVIRGSWWCEACALELEKGRPVELVRNGRVAAGGGEQLPLVDGGEYVARRPSARELYEQERRDGDAA